MTTNTHFLIEGGQVKSQHADGAVAGAAAIAQARQGRTVQVVALVSTVAPNTGVVVTDATGNSQVVK